MKKLFNEVTVLEYSLEVITLVIINLLKTF